MTAFLAYTQFSIPLCQAILNGFFYCMQLVASLCQVTQHSDECVVLNVLHTIASLSHVTKILMNMWC